MKTICPKCGHKTQFPTPRQIEAYKNVYIHGMSLIQTAAIMRITKQAVYQLLDRMEKLRPDLFGVEELPTLDNTQALDLAHIDESRIVRKW